MSDVVADLGLGVAPLGVPMTPGAIVIFSVTGESP